MGFLDAIGSIFGGGGGGDASGGGSGGMFPTGGGGGGGGIMDMILPLLVGGGGALASNILNRGANKNIDQANKALSAETGLTKQGEELVKQAQAGKLTPSQQSTVDAARAEQTARWRQHMADLGIPMSSAEVQGQGVVDQNIQKITNDFLNTSFQQGMDMLKLGGTAAQAQLKSAMEERAATSKTIWDVAQEIGRVLGTKPGQNPPGSPAGGAGGNADVPADWTNYGQVSYPDVTAEPDPYAGTISPDVSYT